VHITWDLAPVAILFVRKNARDSFALSSGVLSDCLMHFALSDDAPHILPYSTITCFLLVHPFYFIPCAFSIVLRCSKSPTVMALRKNHTVFVEKFISISFLFLLEVIPLLFTLISRPFPSSSCFPFVNYSGMSSGVNRTMSWVEFTTQRTLHRRESECLDSYMDYYIKIRSACAWIRANRSRF